MAITTKSALAAELRITKPRVSQYVKRGLPVRKDGKLNRDQALNWLNQNQLGVIGEDRGANRAARLVKECRPRKQKTASQAGPAEMAIDALSLIVREIGAFAARMAIEFGAPLKTAYALDSAVCIEAGNIAERYLTSKGIPDFAAGWTLLEMQGLTIVEPDWPALAE
jgi:hypothetical protein